MRLEISPRCARKLKKIAGRSRTIERRTEKVIAQLRRDPFHSSLETHKLTGKLRGTFACSVTHDYRLIFALDEKTVFLLNIGTHDEVYG